MELEGLKITVVGAGIGGLTAATALARRGARVDVLEQADDIGEVGAGVQISPNGGVVLDALGLGAQLDTIATKAAAVHLKDYRAGRSVLKLDLTRIPGKTPYRLVHRADLVNSLVNAARREGVRICLLHPVTGLRADDGGKPVIRTGQGTTVRPDLVIGADGLHSVIRQSLNGDEAPFFTGQVAWRALAPVSKAPPPGIATVHMAPGRHVVTYPLRNGRIMNIVAVEERAEWAGESWSSCDDPANLQRAFRAFCPEVRDLIGRAGKVHLWGLFRHGIAPKWHRGNVAILGDAAHPTLPFLAQGASMAIEDAWVLAASLARSGDIPAGLALYQKRRQARVTRVVNAASKNAGSYHLRLAPARFAAHMALRASGAVAPALVLRRFDWLYRHDVTAEG